MPLPYQQAFDRIRAEYLEMPGMRLTAPQVQRLCGIDSAVCQSVLDDLVRARFLSTGLDGSYVRCATREPGRLSRAAASVNPRSVVGPARRAS